MEIDTNDTIIAGTVDPKQKSIYGKFVANDHSTEVFYGVVLKFDENHKENFFEGDEEDVYRGRSNVLRMRRKTRVKEREAERKERARQRKAKLKGQI